jgi:hypothetical protein
MIKLSYAFNFNLLVTRLTIALDYKLTEFDRIHMKH